MLLITKPRSGEAGVLCEVARETAQRYYVVIVRAPGARHWYPSWLTGKPTELYVEKEHVDFLDVTAEDYADYLNIWRAYKQDLDRLEEEYHRQNKELRERRRAAIEGRLRRGPT